MSTVASVWASIWKGRAEPPTATQISNNGDLNLGSEIIPRQGYFQITVNELFLENSRQWLTKVAPMVVAVTEFTYAGESCVVPFVVGPGRLGALQHAPEPTGMLYRDTRVAGLHPYAGGQVSVAVVLCQVPVGNAGEHLLRVIEGTSQALDFSTVVSPYVKVGKAVLSGISDLLGLKAATPVLGWKQSFGRDGTRPLVPSYFALIAAPDIPRSELWVKEGQLCRGTSRDTARPYRDSDFVLFSITQPRNGLRSDLSQLPFFPLWQRTLKEAWVTTPEGLKSLQANFTALSQEILLSPDLTQGQAEALIDLYWNELKAVREKARSRVLRAAPSADDSERDPIDQARHRSLRAFDLV